jgi:phosphoserine phosphatase
MTTHALLLTASPAAPGLDETVIAALRPQLAPAQLIDQRWLAEGVAWQGLVVTGAPGEPAPLRARLGAALAPRPIDINLVPADAARRRKKLLVADMESTIIQQECLDELAARVGLRERISQITARAMRGDLAF